MTENDIVPYPSFNENQKNNNNDKFHTKENKNSENPLQTKGNENKSENILLFSNNPSQIEESRGELNDKEQNQMSVQQAISTKNPEIKKIFQLLIFFVILTNNKIRTQIKMK